MTVQGNLTFQPGALYLVQLDPTSTTSATVTGSATLGGDVGATFASGHYLTRQYDILHAGSINGKFDALETLNLPQGVLASLVYTPTDVFLDLTASLSTQGLNLNQLAVANAIDNFFNNGGALPPGFLNLFNLTGANLGNALTALDGENATGAEHVAFELMNEFLNLMLDANLAGRNGGGGGAIGFAPDQEASFPPDIALAYAGVLKAPPKQNFAQRWTTWASGFGGGARTNGDPIIGSNTITTDIFGFAAGMDYHYSPDTVVGFALAGAGTNWNLAQGLGTGRSDAFLAGIYGVTHQGPAYVGGALAFANNWFSTNRTALGDQLTARFQGQSYAARLEGGYRFLVPASHDALGVTPYAAIQAQNFHTPAYSEADLTAGGFGLTYAAMNGTDTRSELGARFDDFTAFGAMPLILRAKAAWAHDWVSNPALNAIFQALPGASFTVFGAPFPHDSALTSAGAQLFFTPHWSLLAKFDGEFAKGAQTYAGAGTLRYTW
jgi:outer membrane autotransporter protein